MDLTKYEKDITIVACQKLINELNAEIALEQVDLLGKKGTYRDIALARIANYQDQVRALESTIKKILAP